MHPARLRDSLRRKFSTASRCLHTTVTATIHLLQVSLSLTSPAAGAPNPVTNVLHSESAVAVNLTWTNPGSGSFTGVMVRRAAGTTPPATASAGTLVSDVVAPAAAVLDSGLASGTTYSYSLFAHDAYGNYEAAATATVTTLPSGSAPSAGTRPSAPRPPGVQRLTAAGVWTPAGREPGSLQGIDSGLMSGPNCLARTLHYRYVVSGVLSSTSRVRHKVLVNCTDVRFAYGNYEISNGANDITVRAGLEITSSDIVPITFNGQRDVVIPSGQTVLLDPIHTGLFRGATSSHATA